MPNRNYNWVIVGAPKEQVKEYFIKIGEEPETYKFNMHKLFPETFPEGDELGNDNWNYDWACDTTGSKWFPDLEIEDQGDETILTYETAWAPNNGTLERLHNLTSWRITNEYEEPNMQFE